MLPSGLVTGLNDAIARAQAHVLTCQAPDGPWVGECEGENTITAEYVLLCHLLDRVNHERQAKAVRYLKRRQRPDGGYALFEGGPTNLSATIKAYFAMKVAGVPVKKEGVQAAMEHLAECARAPARKVA